MKETYKALKPATKKWINGIRKKFVLESHHDRLLVLAGCTWDRAIEARGQIQEEGSVVLDRFGQKKQHPAVQTENQAMLTFAKLLRELGLDLERPDDSRPAQRPGGY